ncbi:uncharacterized protein HMPREF1541_07502 [Cyphellophora europaea CBS 101466]|uniref:Uncharacterized protein n=1 Tax=Cyphellophora europaea (strain CBS 101466) TaxID=1220924 RepID=W2RQ93_CYPE1|nr:uncharacterized protein HMPREF1541_07502 [Cyphellophora europaea CBS 101466]ETN37879.1 hypothetical protein HMPREF1541_07502 [Cyphellophora europaea CBS 101466]
MPVGLIGGARVKEAVFLLTIRLFVCALSPRSDTLHLNSIVIVQRRPQTAHSHRLRHLCHPHRTVFAWRSAASALSTIVTNLQPGGLAITADDKYNDIVNNETPNEMTEASTSEVANDVTATDKQPNDLTDNQTTLSMTNVKTEDAPEVPKSVSNGTSDNPTKAADEPDADGDSEAETLIQSPEKKKNAVEGAPVLQPTGSNTIKRHRENGDTPDDGTKKPRKRKRDIPNLEMEPSRTSSSSPLSSPNPQAHTRDSDSDISDTPRSARNQRSKRTVSKAESDVLDGARPSKVRRRRPSDILAPSAKHRSKGSTSTADGTSERRETRSATYPRQSSEDRSPSPRPISRGHRRGVSTQLVSGEFERKKRGRPPNISTKRTISTERHRSSSSDGDSSPPDPRPSLEKFDSRDHMSPAKASGPRKYRDKNGRTFLSRACNNDDLERAKQCYKERPEDLNLSDNAGNTPLQIAALQGSAEIVQFLLENGAEVDTRNIDKETPLIDAVENGHLEVVRLLLEFGANPRSGNTKGDEPYELVPLDDENYDTIRKLIADAKEQDFTKRRKSSDNAEAHREGSSRAASAASARDSPPILGPRSPPTLTSRRRTGRSESTRNDLLWQSHTQENLRLLASKGNVQGVATILNVLQKAEPAAVIAAAKAGHEEVLQYLLAMGEADPDPDPLSDHKPGYNTPMLAAIGRGNLDVIKLLVEQTGFNPSRKWRGKTYYEIAQERRGESWAKEVNILKEAYEKHMSGKAKTKSPKKLREPPERTKERRARRSESPPSSNLRTSSSPTMTHKSLPDKSPRSLRKDSKKELSSPPERERRKVDALKDDNAVAVVSDQEQSVHEKRGHKHRRSQSDLPLPPTSEAESLQRRRRLVTGKEHRRSQSGAGGPRSDGSASEIEVKRERQTPGLKRNRASVSPEPKDGDAHRVVVKKRRTVLESSPEESRPALKVKQAHMAEPQDAQMKDGKTEELAGEINVLLAQANKSLSPEISTQDAPGEPDTELVPPSEQADDETVRKAAEEAEQKKQEELRVAVQKEAEEKAAEDQRRAEEEKVAAERAAAEKAAEEKAEAERLAAQRAAAEQAEAERRAAEAAEARRKAEEAEARRLAEEEEAKRKAEEEAAARKKEEEERQERQRRERELEDRQRRQEEQIRQQHLEIERRRREALPAALSRASLLLDTGNFEEAKSHAWLSHFLPLYTVRTAQLDPVAHPAMADEKWIPNFQAAVLLATKDLNLRNYTALEKRPVSAEEQERLWKVGRHMLSYEYPTNSYNTSIKKAKQVEAEQRPKFLSMTEVFWVKLSDFNDQIYRHDHLSGLYLREQKITIRIPDQITPHGSPRTNGIYGSPPTPQIPNGIHIHANGGPR